MDNHIFAVIMDAKTSAPLVKKKSETPGRPFVVRVILPELSEKIKDHAAPIPVRVAYSEMPTLDARPKSKRKDEEAA